jgi:Flp pilus assembly protein CpaB
VEVEYVRRRWSRSSKLFAVLAFLFGLGAFAVVRAHAAHLEALRPIVGEPVPVVVSASRLTRGTTLTASALGTEQMPSSFAPPGAIADPADAEGRTLLTDLAEGEPVTATRLSDEASGPVAALVPPGLRAVTVGSAFPRGAVRPGDRVDVLATFGGGRPHTETVATGLEVLTVLAPETSAGAGSPTVPSLVLLVGPEDAESLAYATAFADLSVSIAGPE